MRRNCLRNWVLALATGAIAISSTAAEQVLLDFTGNFDLGGVAATDATAARSESGPALRVRTGCKAPWPGVTLRAPGGAWDLSQFAQVTMRVRNAGADKVTVYCRVDNEGADGTDHCVTASTAVNPGATETLKVPLKQTGDDKLGGKLFGMRGYPVRRAGRERVDARHITQLLVFVSKPNAEHVFEIAERPRHRRYTPPTAWVTDAAPFFPFMDTFGQYRHKDWPGKASHWPTWRPAGSRRPPNLRRTRPERLGPLRRLGRRTATQGNRVLPHREGRRQVVAGGPGRPVCFLARH